MKQDRVAAAVFDQLPVIAAAPFIGVKEPLESLLHGSYYQGDILPVKFGQGHRHIQRTDDAGWSFISSGGTAGLATRAKLY